jgi:hypothetical protein
MEFMSIKIAGTGSFDSSQIEKMKISIIRFLNLDGYFYKK